MQFSCGFGARLRAVSGAAYPACVMDDWKDWKTSQPKNLGELWTLTKRGHSATCVLVGHPKGSEVRVEIDGELQRSEAFREGALAVAASQDWRRLFEEKGWTEAG